MRLRSCWAASGCLMQISRRDFLATSSAAAALVVVSPVSIALPAPDPPIFQDFVGYPHGTPIWRGEYEGLQTLGWLDTINGKRYGNFFTLEGPLESRYKEIYFQVLHINHCQATGRKRRG